MEDLEDELDLRFHKGLNPDVYYRCATLESLEGALRNELDKNAASFIPTDVVTEFIFATVSTITIPVTRQSNLDVLIQPAHYLQSIAVEYALCRDIGGKDRLKSLIHHRSIIEAIQGTDGFRYLESSAQSKEGGDGARLKYVCQDSLQNKDRKNNMNKEKYFDNDDQDAEVKRQGPTVLSTYDCGGAIHIKFSLKRNAINVVYKHNPIHTTSQIDESLPALATDKGVTSIFAATEDEKPRKRKRGKKIEVQAENENGFGDRDMDMSTSPEAPKSSTKKRSKKAGDVASSATAWKTSTKTGKNFKPYASPTKPKNIAPISEASPPSVSVRERACIRCREKRIRCDEAKPTCNQCRRGL